MNVPKEFERGKEAKTMLQEEKNRRWLSLESSVVPFFRGFGILEYLHAAAVGGRTSISLPPRIHGLEEAAVTEADSKNNSRPVSWGRCPARLSRSCMSSSRLERAAQTCSSRLELDETWGRRLRGLSPLLLNFCGDCCCCFWANSLYSALSKMPVLAESRLVVGLS